MISYPRRDLAVAYSDAHATLPVWGEDIRPGKGQQRFYATAYDKFRACTKDVNDHDRHFYEMLRPDAPSHLYLDIEYEKACNPTLGDVIPRVDRVIRRGLDVLYDIDKVDAIELDASDSHKFSRHLIYRVRDGRMFKNPFHCGRFLRRLIFPEAVLSSGGSTEVVDRGVYTKWRAFRCAGSSKMRAPERPLLPHRPRSVTFLDTLIQRGDPSSLLTCLEKDGTEPQSGMGPKAGKRKRGDDEDDGSHPETSFNLPESFCRSLAAEIEAVWSSGAVSVANYNRTEQSIFFSSDSRWCAQKGDEHSKNHVYFVADLARGVWRQGCHNRSRESCYRFDPDAKKRIPQWGDWKSFAHSEDVRTFASRSTEMHEEWITLIANVERKFGKE